MTVVQAVKTHQVTATSCEGTDLVLSNQAIVERIALTDPQSAYLNA